MQSGDAPSSAKSERFVRPPACVLVGYDPFLVAVMPRTNSFASAGQLTVIGTRGSPISGTFADRPRDARSPEERGRAQFLYAPPAAFTGTRAANGDVAGLTSLVLGRSKTESVSTFERALVLRPGMLRRWLRRAGRGSAGRSRSPGIVR